MHTFSVRYISTSKSDDSDEVFKLAVVILFGEVEVLGACVVARGALACACW